MEEKIYQRQVTKQSLSQRVCDEHQLDRHFTSQELSELYAFEPDVYKGADQALTLAVPDDEVLADVILQCRRWLLRYHEHDSLLENKLSEGLTDEERKAAWEEYENEKNARQMQSAYLANLAVGMSATNAAGSGINILAIGPGARPPQNGATTAVNDMFNEQRTDIENVERSMQQNMQLLQYYENAFASKFSELGALKSDEPNYGASYTRISKEFAHLRRTCDELRRKISSQQNLYNVLRAQLNNAMIQYGQTPPAGTAATSLPAATAAANSGARAPTINMLANPNAAQPVYQQQLASGNVNAGLRTPGKNMTAAAAPNQLTQQQQQQLQQLQKQHQTQQLLQRQQIQQQYQQQYGADVPQIGAQRPNLVASVNAPKSTASPQVNTARPTNPVASQLHHPAASVPQHTSTPYMNSAMPNSRTVRSYIGSAERPVARQTNYAAAIAAATAAATANPAASNVPPSASAAATAANRPVDFVMLDE